MVKLGRIKLEMSALEHLGVALIEDKIREACLRWFGHVQHKPAAAPVRKSLVMKVDGPPRGKG